MTAWLQNTFLYLVNEWWYSLMKSGRPSVAQSLAVWWWRLCVARCTQLYIRLTLLQYTNNYKQWEFILFIYLGFYVDFNTVQVISREVVGRAEETGTFSWSRFCTVNCRPTASSYQLSHLRSGREPNPDLRGRRRVLPLCHRGPYKQWESHVNLNKHSVSRNGLVGPMSLYQEHFTEISWTRF